MAVVKGSFGVEGDFGYASDLFGQYSSGDNAVLSAMANFIAFSPPAAGVRFYGVAGVGLIASKVSIETSRSEDNLSLGDNEMGFDFGGGVMLPLSGRLSIRGDFRYLRTSGTVSLGTFSNQAVGFYRATGGLSIGL